ncbi:TRAP transporter small permease [Jannaschia sp. W003]|uniref:TRAP transporter small permease n=1 Tax=Jannaschia sp. W003 TaxID=2867012 RepID=UPI0021A33623|nr:TRAP transporter small permease [Jannaschia sp. W003]UWQ20724.1 TRAP transporter small permease [Jannaschia sp. W003]
MSASKYRPKGRVGRFVHGFEENAIAVLLGLMTLLTFVNVVLRYVFGSSLIWGLEVVLILFSWLVIFGVSYGFKVTSHLGVDALTNVMSPRLRRAAALVACAVTIAYAALLLKGAWDYWAPFAGFERTTGRWFPTGFDERTRDQAFYMTDQVPMPGVFRWLEGAINMGEEYEKLPRVIPYVILPVGCALILFRVVQATVRIVRGDAESLIVSHEAEDAVEEVARAHHAPAGEAARDVYEGSHMPPPAGR